MALKAKFRTLFPALVSATSPLTLIKNGLFYVFGFDINALRESLDQFYDHTGITTTTLEQFGGGVGNLDNGPALAAAQGSGSIRIQLGAGVYRFVTPVVINQNAVQISGAGAATVIQFQPVADGTCITFSKGASNQTNCGITDLQFYSTDTTHTKTALKVNDNSFFECGRITCTGTGGTGNSYWAGGTGSIFLQTNGRDTSNFHNFRVNAEKPVVVGLNPNVYLSADHYHFWNMELTADGFPNITCADGVVLTDTTFDGYQAWVRGTHGIYANDTTSTQNWNNVRFSNVRTEQGTDTTAYSFYISPKSGNRVLGVTVENASFDILRKGVFARRVIGLTLRNVSAAATTATEVYNVDSSNDEFVISGCWWSNTATAVNSGLAQKYRAPSPTGTSSTVPPDAIYGSSSSASTFDAIASSNVGLNGATSGTISLLAPAVAGANSVTFPAGTTDFSATGGANRFVKQATAGGAFTVVQPSSSDISGLGTAATQNTGTSGATIPLLNAANTWSADQSNSGGWLSSGTAGVGYKTGAGGTVTQTGAKNSAVTLNKISGQVTMVNSALAGNTTVSFLLNNSTLGSGDSLFCNVVTGFAANGTYQVWAESITAGSAVINVRNITGGSLSEAIVVGFAALKGAVS